MASSAACRVDLLCAPLKRALTAVGWARARQGPLGFGSGSSLVALDVYAGLATGSGQPGRRNGGAVLAWGWVAFRLRE